MTDWANRVTTYSYDNANRLTGIARPNGTYRTQEYDAANRLRYIKEYNSAGTFLLYNELTYDNDGRITQAFLHPKPASFALAADTAEFDIDNQVSTWNSQTVSYDSDGNMTYGPLPGGSLGTYSYDARNRLTSAGGSTYRYNPDGLRVQVTGSGAATYVIDPNASLSRVLMRTANGTTTYYVYGLGLLYEETSGATKSYHFNQVGSTLALTNDGGSVTDRYGYSPFGAVTEHTGTTDSPFLFNGEFGVMTDANGLNYMRARYYNCRLMRFCNADPIGFNGGLNWHMFCGNNPVSIVDPFGLCEGKTVIMEAVYVHATRIWNSAMEALWLPIQVLGTGMAQIRRDTQTVAREVSQLDPLLGRAVEITPDIVATIIAARIAVLAEGAVAAETEAGGAARWIWSQDKGVAKSIRQMDQRGWTPQQVTEAIQSGQKVPAQNLVNPGNPAVRYINPSTGQSVVQDTVTKEIIHFGGPGFKY